MRRAIPILPRLRWGERRRTDLMSCSEQRLLLLPRQERLTPRSMACGLLICMFGKIKKLGQKLFFMLLLSHMGTYFRFTYCLRQHGLCVPFFRA